MSVTNNDRTTNDGSSSDEDIGYGESDGSNVG